MLPASSQASTSIAPASKLLVIDNVMMFFPACVRGNRLVGDAAAKYVSGIVRGVGVECVALGVEVSQLLGLVETIFDRIARHQTARAFCVKTDDLVAAALPVFEHRRDNRRVEQLWLDRLEVLTRSTVDQHARSGSALLQLHVQSLRDPLTP